MKTNIMVTYYNTKDLVSFGNYLLSEERTQNKINSRDESIRQGLNPLSIEEMMAYISDADLANWRFEESIKKSKNFLRTLGVKPEKVKFCTEPNFFFNAESGQMSIDGEEDGFRPIQITHWQSLTTKDLMEQCDSHDWCFFYITDDSKLMTNEMGVIEVLRCAFINDPEAYNTKEDFEELISKERFIIIPLDFFDENMPLNPNFVHDINDLIDQTCRINSWERSDDKFEVIAEKTLPPKASFKIK